MRAESRKSSDGPGTGGTKSKSLSAKVDDEEDVTRAELSSVYGEYDNI